MKTLVIGAAGMIGRKLVRKLDGELILHDVVPFEGSSVVSDLSTPGEAEKLDSRPAAFTSSFSHQAKCDFGFGPQRATADMKG